MKNIFFLLVFVLCIQLVHAETVQIGFGAPAPSTDFVDSSYSSTYISSEGLTVDLTITKEISSNSEVVVEFNEPLNLTVFGDIVDEEVIIGDTFVYVDSVLRPDLDVNATLTFINVPFAIQPDVLKDGEDCLVSECLSEQFDADSKIYSFQVVGFSNYSLTARQDFEVQSDPQPELDNAPQDKVYQTIDLGDSYRSDVFNCVVQIYGQNDAGQFILVQTNPQRRAQGFIISPDSNLPESIGYFRTTNGLANVYYDASKLAGYQDLEYVVQCANNSTKLIYEESISTRYRPVGRSITARGVWFASGSNALFMIISVIVIFIIILLLVKVYKVIRK
jgi:hypothetical protein